MEPILLKDNEPLKKEVKEYLDDIFNILLDKEDIFSKDYSKWMKTKLIDSYKDIMYDSLYQQLEELSKKNDEASRIEHQKIYRKRRNYQPENYPSRLKIGEIVHVEFGKSYCTELSDGHYGVILSNRIGSHYLIAPLSSTKPKGRILHYGDLGLPSKNRSNDSYVKFDQIKFISYRRLKNIDGILGGRKNINIDKGHNRVKEILDAFNQIIQN